MFSLLRKSLFYTQVKELSKVEKLTNMVRIPALISFRYYVLLFILPHIVLFLFLLSTLVCVF